MRDLLVIGGGINGLGIAAEAAKRGLSVLLVEKGDVGGGTSAASSRLIHGGLRYLQHGEFSLVRESLHDRGLLARERPHLVRPIRLLIPCYRGLGMPPWMIRTGLSLYDLLARDPLFPPSESLSAAAVREREPGIAPDGLAAGFLYPDGQIEFPERLCVELMREIREAGGEVRTYTRAVALRQQGSRVTGAAFRDELTGEEWDGEAKLTINAAGPWVDLVNRLLPHPPPPLIGGTWGTHLVLPVRPEGPRGPLYTQARKDGRPIFLLPWDGRLLVGTTDVPFEGDPDTLRVQDWEREYLLAETNRLFPGCAYREADIQYTTIGVRPLPRSRRSAGAITRRHLLVDHGKQHGLPGLVSVVGGKLTTFRSLAEQTLAHCGLRIVEDPRAPLGGGLGDRVTVEPLAGETTPGLSSAVRTRLRRLYGSYAPEVTTRRELLRPLIAGNDVLEAEVVHAVEAEEARTVEDVLLRRLMLLPPSKGAAEAVRGVCKRLGLELRGIEATS